MLSLSGNKIGPAGNLAIANALQLNTTLEQLAVAATDADTTAIIAYATVLQHTTSLQAIDLSRPLLKSDQVRSENRLLLLCSMSMLACMQEETTVHLAQALAVNTSLKRLMMQKSGIHDFGMERLMAGLARNTTLTHLDLSR